MGDRIVERLEPVRRRQLRLEVVHSAVLGLLASSCAAGGLGILRWQGAGAVSGWAVAILLAGPVLGALVALVRGRSAQAAARATDGHYRLKDRTVSAVDFLRRADRSQVCELQLADALEHLQSLDPRQIAPWRMPAAMPYAVATSILALGLVLWPRATPVQARTPDPLEHVVAAALEAEESLAPLEEVAKKENDPKLKELVQKLSETIKEMKLPGVDTKEALAKLSEMQAAIAAQQAQFNVGLVDAQMEALGEAMASTQALEGAGQALQQGKYDKAAQELERAEPKFDRKEAKALKEKLAQAAKAMQDAGLTDMSTATTELSESLDDENTAAGACKKLGNLARSQGRRKRVRDLLALSSNLLSECKGNCQNNNTAKIRLRRKSDTPSSNWGMGTSGNVDGERTKLDAARKREEVQGQMGEGDSETETTHMPEGRQTASRSYREQYQKYRRMTEAALNSEPIPLGHRQTIRRYFELIRPQNDEAEKAQAEARK
jgi:hypothetical protein